MGIKMRTSTRKKKEVQTFGENSKGKTILLKEMNNKVPSRKTTVLRELRPKDTFTVLQDR